MGFYGNISNAGKTQISFDRIYANRRQMEEFCSSDNIFIGRKILIEYDDNTYPRRQGYIKSEDINKDGLVQLYLDTELINPYRKTVSDIEVGYGFKEYDIVMVHYEDYYYYYVCEKFDKEGIAQFSLVKADSEKQTDYTINFLIDREWAKNNGIDFANGWDSTVWEKTVRDGVQCYAMEASLNSIPPTFKLAVEPPSEVPILPRFGTQRTNLEYTLHVQPTWGFRTKEIDYNKDGFSKENRNYKNQDDKIEITEAQSENLYTTNDNKPHEKEKANDIKELSIILPTIGNTISDIWDIVYGADKERDTIISWDKADGKRLVKQNETGYLFESKDVATLAGCINSTHDLMGRIIENEPQVKVNDALTNKIYYGAFGDNEEYKSFYIKDLTYTYTESEVPSTPKRIEDMRQFETGKYYFTSNNNYYLEENEYSFGNKYYNLEGITEVTLLDGYKSNKYYYEDKGNYNLDLSEDPNEERIYYNIIEEKMTSITSPYKSGINENPVLFFKPINPYVENDVQKGYVYKEQGLYRPVNENSILDNSLNYYWAEGFGIERRPSPDYPNDPFKDQLNYIIDEEDIKYPVRFINFDEAANYYYKNENNNYIKLISIESIDNNVVYKQFNEESKIKIEHLFYEPNTYYYSSNGKDYIFAIEPNKLQDVKYYKLDPATKIDATFYEPNKYWYYLENELVLDESEFMDTEKDYFKYSPLYVKQDNSGMFKVGALWNHHVEKPKGVTLGTREESWKWKELKGFAKNLNTIHGLIVKINNILKSGDLLTRDRQTVQGCINKINDIINTFDTLIPGQIAIVDKYGRLTSAPYKTDKWINLQVDNGVINVTHSDPVPLQNPLEKKDLTLSFGDLFTIPEWAFDDKGHKTDSITHEIKIPEWNLEDVEHNNADIITNLSFTPTSGKLKTTRKNIVDLVLTNYELGNNNSNIVDTDTIGQAFGKTQNKINEIAAWISDEDAGAAKMKADINIINEKLTDEKITKWDQAEQNVQSDWLVEDESADNFIKNKPDLTNLVKTDTQFNYTFGDVTIQMTIEGLLNYIASLEARIYNLENPIEEEVPPVE